MKHQKSRRKTPWEGSKILTPTQAFLKQNYDSYYAERHRKVEDSGEAEMINSYVPFKCPFCKRKHLRHLKTTLKKVRHYFTMKKPLTKNL